MNIVLITQIIGAITIFILFCLDFWIAINPSSTKKTLQISMLWTSIYFFFLFILRVLNLFHLGTLDQLRIISGVTSFIPLIAVVAQLFLQKKLDE